MAAEHETLERWVIGRHPPDAEPEIESGTLPRDPSEGTAENVSGQALALSCRGDGNDGVGVHVIDMPVRAEGMERRVDARGSRVQVERAVRKSTQASRLRARDPDRAG